MKLGKDHKIMQAYRDVITQVEEGSTNRNMQLASKCVSFLDYEMFSAISAWAKQKGFPSGLLYEDGLKLSRGKITILWEGKTHTGLATTINVEKGVVFCISHATQKFFTPWPNASDDRPGLVGGITPDGWLYLDGFYMNGDTSSEKLAAF